MGFLGVRLADRRDEAVAAVLAGAVVVILGFASGLGIPVAGTDQPAAAGPAAPPPAHPDPGTQAPPAGAGSVGGGGGGTPSGGGVVTGPKPSPTPSTGPTTPDQPTPSPSPPVSCPPGLIGGLPVVGPLVATSPTPGPVPSLLGDLPIVGPLVTPGKPGVLSCPVGVLVGPSCCATATTTGKQLVP
ncbi:hypothetical protein [Fodinicola acaciae]|uniref:hypothetical protein n=1 Tax=Fodinicola acaciae TaxID=2681555 RepID=UPI0013D45088|nr:hypothetical protein [Fodinicola acaciae]